MRCYGSHLLRDSPVDGPSGIGAPETFALLVSSSLSCNDCWLKCVVLIDAEHHGAELTRSHGANICKQSVHQIRVDPVLYSCEPVRFHGSSVLEPKCRP